MIHVTLFTYSQGGSLPGADVRNTTKDFKDVVQFLNSVKFISLRIYFTSLLLRRTNEIIRPPSRRKFYWRRENTLSQVRNRVTREI